jgi:outer membrane protein assembly factor BamB
MRIVEYHRDTRTPAYRALWVLGVVAGLFSLLVCAFMIANNLLLKKSDPVHTPALQKLVLELKASPQNEALKEQIREMDYLARRAFFTSQHFNQIAIWLLAGGLTVTVVAFKTISTHHRKLPYPDSHDPKDDLAANALWARQSVTVIGLILVGLALSLALPWKSTLDHPPAESVTAPAPAEHKPAATGKTAATTPAAAPLVAKTPAPTAAAAPTGPPPATREERLQQWPSFRGAANARATTGLPTHWDGKSGEGIVWKTPIPLPGFGSPIVWGDRVFVSGANAKARAIYCVDAKAGALLWEKDVAGIPGSPSVPPEVTADTGYAAPTMTTDGARVFAIFANGDLVAFTQEGVPIWAQNLGVPENPYGHSSSLEIFGDTLITQFDHKKDGFVAAFDVRTGATRWKTERKLGPSWASPALVEREGRTELILVAGPFAKGYDPKSGKELWSVQCLATADVAPTPVFADGLLFVAADHVKLAAVDLSARKVVWEFKDEVPGIGTPLATDGLLICGLGDGGIACWEAKTGRRLWMQETDDGFYASPILSGNRVYLIDRAGKMFIFEASGAAFKSIAQPTLGEEAVTTPAIYGKSLIYRGVKNLFRIGT